MNDQPEPQPLSPPLKPEHVEGADSMWGPL